MPIEVRPVYPFLNLVNVVSDSKTMFGWKFMQGSNFQVRGQGVLCGGAWRLEFPSQVTVRGADPSPHRLPGDGAV